MATFVDEKSAMKIIVCGSRTFDDYALLSKMMNGLTRKFKEMVIVSGAAKGADALGERWAFSRMITVKRFHPDWETYGKGAYSRRNQEMIDYADRLVAFHDGESPGTKQMIELARKKHMKCKVILYNELEAE